MTLQSSFWYTASLSYAFGWRKGFEHINVG